MTGLPWTESTALVKARLAWFNLFGSISGQGAEMGMEAIYTDGLVDEPMGGNDYGPAYQDLVTLENRLFKGILRGFHAWKTPKVLHRIGYSRGEEIRDLTLFGRSGAFQVIPFDEQNAYRRDTASMVGDRKQSLEEAMAFRFMEVMKETPYATFLLHSFGTPVDFSLSHLISSLGYNPIADRSLCVPERQTGNLNTLSVIENLTELDICSLVFKNAKRFDLDEAYSMERARRAFAYPLEKDTAQYFVLVNTKLMAINNRRGIRAAVRQAKEKHPNQPLLIHRMGSKVDFSLAEQLLQEDIWDQDEWVERKEERTPTGVPPIEDLFD